MDEDSFGGYQYLHMLPGWFRPVSSSNGSIGPIRLIEWIGFSCVFHSMDIVLSACLFRWQTWKLCSSCSSASAVHLYVSSGHQIVGMPKQSWLRVSQTHGEIAKDIHITTYTLHLPRLRVASDGVVAWSELHFDLGMFTLHS